MSNSTTSPNGGAHEDAGANVNAWNSQVGTLATALGLDLLAVNTALQPEVGEPGDVALECLLDSTIVSDEKIKELLKFSGAPAVFKLALKKFREGSKAEAASNPTTATPPQPQAAANPFAGIFGGMGGGVNGGMMSISLPDVPNFGADWLSTLSSERALRPSKELVAALIRATYGSNNGLFGVVDRIMQKIDDRAESQGEDHPPLYEELEAERARRTQGDLYKALRQAEILPKTGLNRFASKAKKQTLMEKANKNLWPALKRFHDSLTAIQEGSFGEGGLEGIMMMSMGMSDFDPNEFSSINSELTESLNYLFAAGAAKTAWAMAADAEHSHKLLEKHRSVLPGLLGETSYESMLRGLGVGLSRESIQMSNRITQYAMIAIDLPKILDSGQSPYFLLMKIKNLGKRINWDTIGKVGQNISSPQYDEAGAEDDAYSPAGAR